ncbi:MAG: hypothetical protein JSV18_00765 [Candidatus Bathyarchaeota archaeon]|nr:MAG: hypothetical protein JSV18_00765 [Candidatus Bathyarchaeota archaeon]
MPSKLLSAGLVLSINPSSIAGDIQPHSRINHRRIGPKPHVRGLGRHLLFGLRVLQFKVKME